MPKLIRIWLQWFHYKISNSVGFERGSCHVLSRRSKRNWDTPPKLHRAVFMLVLVAGNTVHREEVSGL